MITELFLWLNTLFFSMYFTGHLFDLLANVPNWKSGTVEDVTRYRSFYSRTSPKDFFRIIVPGTPLLCLVCLILVWHIPPVNYYIGASFLIAVAVLLFTVRFFLPINKYIFERKEYDPDRLKRKVSAWVRMDYLRIILVAMGLLTALVGLRLFIAS